MRQVATGGDSRIPIPFLLIVPHLLNSDMSILGFGDIVLPGLLVGSRQCQTTSTCLNVRRNRLSGGYEGKVSGRAQPLVSFHIFAGV